MKFSFINDGFQVSDAKVLPFFQKRCDCKENLRDFFQPIAYGGCVVSFPIFALYLNLSQDVIYR